MIRLRMGEFSSEVKRSEASHEDEEHRVRSTDSVAAWGPLVPLGAALALQAALLQQRSYRSGVGGVGGTATLQSLNQRTQEDLVESQLATRGYLFHQRRTDPQYGHSAVGLD